MRSTKSYLNKFIGENRAGYAYTNTRVRVMKTKLLRKEDYEKLLKMSLTEITRFLEDSEYKKEIDALSQEFTGLNLIEYSTIKNLEKTFRKIYDFSIKSSYEQVKLYLKKYDAWNIKTILRGKQSNAENNEIKNNLIVVGELKRERLEQIIEKTKTIEEAIKEFKGTEYYEILEKNKNSLPVIEDELDKKYYSELLEKGQDDLKKFTLRQIKAINTLNEIRAKKTGLKIEKISGSTELIEIPKEFQGKEEAFLKKKTLTANLKMLHLFKATVAPLLAYFIAKETEIVNIRIITRGKHAMLPIEKIKENIIIA